MLCTTHRTVPHTLKSGHQSEDESSALLRLTKTAGQIRKSDDSKRRPWKGSYLRARGENLVFVVQNGLCLVLGLIQVSACQYSSTSRIPWYCQKRAGTNAAAVETRGRASRTEWERVPSSCREASGATGLRIRKSAVQPKLRSREHRQPRAKNP